MMPMKIYSLVLFLSMIFYLGRLIYLSKDQGRFYKALLYSVGVFYILAFINDFPRIFLGREYSILGKYLARSFALPFLALLFLIALQFFLFLKFYSFRWIYSAFYWILCVRFVAYPYDVSFSGEGQILLYIAGGPILMAYLWIILFAYRRKRYCKILLCILSLWIFAFWSLFFILNIPIDFLMPLETFLRDSKLFGAFLGLFGFPLALLGGPIFYLIFYIGEVLVLGGCIKAEIEKRMKD